MVNMGRIERYNGKYGLIWVELSGIMKITRIREVFMISSNLIISDDKSMIEIGENDIL